MSTNPFYNADPAQKPDDTGQDEPAGALRPITDAKADGSSDAAVELIRRKLAAIYHDEPDAGKELAEAEAPAPTGQQHSKHQRFMQSLHASGKSMSEIQTAWHQYYQDLPDAEKHEVWQEFYSQSARAKQHASRIEPRYTYQPDTIHTDHTETPRSVADSPSVRANNPLYEGGSPEVAAGTAATAGSGTSGSPFVSSAAAAAPAQPPADDRPVDIIRQQLRTTVSNRGNLKVKHHLQSLLFGLGFGGLVVLIILFSFFNEVVVAPFIQPSRKVSATPIIVSPDGVAPSKDNEVIIPKINVQIPLDFTPKTTDEKEFEAALDKGVTHYPTTALPGQQGNASFFGHSSNNIFNPGKYKFAFVLLNELVPGDMFYLNYNGTTYGYQVYDKKIVAADAVEILNPVADKKATAMLVTCDPPGTSLRRLAVWGEQITPNPNSNTVAAAPATNATSTQTDLPGNGPTLWRRLINSITGNDDQN